MIQVARDGKVILEVADGDVFWDKVATGEIRPTDHCWAPGDAAWRPVGQVRPDDASAFQKSPAGSTADAELEIIQRRIEQLVEAAPLSRPGVCCHCGDSRLKTAQLVYEQGTRVGVGYDFGDNDITLFGSKNLQSLGLSPPSRPGNAESSGGYGCLAATLALACVGTINMYVVAGQIAEMPGERGSPVLRLLLALLLLGELVLGVLIYRWLMRKFVPARRRRLARKYLGQAIDFNRWKNTWICGACGRMTVRTAKEG